MNNGMKWYAVTGREPGDDEDTTLIFQAESQEAAEEQFKEAIVGHLTADDIASIDSVYSSSGGVYFNGTLESDTEIRSCP